MTQLVLPWPPAVNNLFFNAGNRRVRTKRYDAWLFAAAASLKIQRITPIKGPFSISILCEPPDRRRRDLDGLAKAPLDLLVKAGVIEDDSLARSIGLFWSDNPPAKPGCVKITLEAVKAAPVLAVAA